MIYRKDIKRPLTNDEVDANFKEIYSLLASGLSAPSTGYVTHSELNEQVNLLKPLIGALSGAGYPENKISAPVGTIYIDKNSTNGAVLWIKALGESDVGWRVLYGDTGWREIKETIGLSANTSSSFKIRRVNSEIMIEANIIKNNASSPVRSDTVLPIELTPTINTFIPLYTTKEVNSVVEAKEAGFVLIDVDGWITYHGDIENLATMASGSVRYVAKNDWLSELTGTAS